MGRRVRKFDGPSGRGLWYRPLGDEYKGSVTGFTFSTIWHEKHSADWLAVLASPYPAAPDFSTGKRVTRFSGRFASLRIVFPCHPYAGGQNKTPRNILFISISTVSTGCCATSKRGKGGGVSHQRGNLHRPPGRLYSFRRLWRHKKWRRRRRTSPAQRYFIPPEGGALNPSGRRQPVPDRTLAAQGRKARRLAQPSRP